MYTNRFQFPCSLGKLPSEQVNCSSKQYKTFFMLDASPCNICSILLQYDNAVHLFYHIFKCLRFQLTSKVLNFKFVKLLCNTARFLTDFLLRSQLLSLPTKNMCVYLSLLVKSSLQESTQGYKCNALYAQCIMHTVPLLFLSVHGGYSLLFLLFYKDNFTSAIVFIALVE